MKKYTIIVIEDDKGLGRLISKNIKRLGYDVKHAETGTEAMKIVTGSKNEILLVDYKLPDTSGKQLVQKLQKKFDYTPNFIILTGYGNEKIAVEMMKMGAKDYIIKENDFIDILSRKLEQIIDELEKNKENERYQKLLHNTERLAGVGGWLWYVKSDKWVMSENWMALHGCSEKSLTTDDLLQIAHPQDAKRISKAIANTAKTGEPYKIEHRIIRKDNREIRYIKAFGEAELDDEGNVQIVSGAALDITEQKNTEDNFKLNEKRLESLLRIAQKSTSSIQELLDFALHEAIDLTSSRIGYIYFYDENKRQFILNTWSKEVMKECKVMDPQTLYNLDDTGCWGEAVRQRRPIIINDYKADNPLKKGTPKGHVKLKKFLTIPVILEGKIVAVAGVANKKEDYNDSDVRQLSLLMDSVWKISERIKLLNELRMAKEKAEESDRLKSAFLANMSHEIRTPMNGILGFTGLLQEPSLTGEEQKQFINIIHKSGKRMLDTVNDLIDISKIETGQVKVTTEQIDICHEIETLYTFFKLEAEQKGLQLILEKHLPSNGNSIITTDKVKLVSILTNLIKNALKYTPKGTVKLECAKKEDSFLFLVKDTGIGIPRHRQQAIFNRFEQADIGDTRAFEGSGLGLAITKAYVEMLDGKIWVDSEEGAGSTFYIKLPWKSTEPLGTIAENAETKNYGKLSGYKPKLLIAEDDEVSFYHLSIVLKKHAGEIIHAKNGKQAVELLKQHPDIDVILMDIKMPVLNGFDATRKIREFNKDVIIIAQTAYALAGDDKKTLDAGCNDYISKPVDVDKLLMKFEKYSQKKQTI